MQGIYIIRNLINNRVYVGSTINFKMRFDLHRSCLRRNKHITPHLQYAWNKYGEENFLFEPVEIIPNDINLKENLLKREQWWINQLKEHVYNTSKFAGCEFLGRRHTEEWKRMMSENRTGFKHSDETKKKLSKILKGKFVGEKNPFFGKKHTEECRRKNSEWHKGNGIGRDNNFYGHKQTEYCRKAVAESNRKRGVINKQRNIIKGWMIKAFEIKNNIYYYINLIKNGEYNNGRGKNV